MSANHPYKDLEKRINERLAALNLSARQASMLAGGSPDLVRNISRGKSRSPRAENVSNLAHVLEVSIDWLLTGQGNMNDPREPDSKLQKIKVPLIDWVSAGKMSYSDIGEEIIGFVEETGLDRDGDWIALRVKGDSMDRISPPESIIFVDRRDQVLVPNACYVISNTDGEATYKRFRPNPMRFEPVSTNSLHEPIYPTREPLIVGRVKKSILDM